MTNVARTMVALTACATAALVSACQTTPAAPVTTVVVPVIPPVPELPWTVGELTYHPCAVLDADDTARFVLEQEGEPTTPPNALPACSWDSVQTSASGRFSVRFTPSSSDLSDPSRRVDRDPAEQQITLGGNRAAVKPGSRYPDSTHGSCAVDVAVPSGGSFGVYVGGGGMRTGVAWDPCPKAVDIAGVIAGKMH